MTSEPILKVAIAVPLSRLFDYLPPKNGPLPAIGARVRVAFGKRRVTGLVLGLAAESGIEHSRLKRCEALLDDTPLVDEELLWLLRFTSDYYHHPLGEVVAAALPALLRQGQALYPVREVFAATAAGAAADLDALARRAPQQAALLELLCDAGNPGLDAAALDETRPNWRRAAVALIGKGLALRFEARADEGERAVATDPAPAPDLTEAQQKALAAIRASDGYGAFLLDGVTGSGKTEVYLRLIAEVIASGRTGAGTGT